MKQVPRVRVRRRKVHEGTWFISYGDMITLLLGFFVLFFSIEKPTPGNTLLAESLLATLEQLDRELPSHVLNKEASDGGISKSGRDTPAKMDATQVEDPGKEPGADLASQEGAGKEKTLGDHMMDILNTVIPFKQKGAGEFAAKEKPEQERRASESLWELTGMSPLEKGTPTGAEAKASDDGGYRENIVELEALKAEAIQQDDKIYIMFPQVSFFGSASTKLTKEGFDTIKKFGKVYLPFAGQTRLNIIGFADQRPVRASMYAFKDNLELSVLRAVSAQRVLANLGVPAQRVRLLGHGIKTKLLKEEKPVSEADALALARKIMFIIEPERPST